MKARTVSLVLLYLSLGGSLGASIGLLATGCRQPNSPTNPLPSPPPIGRIVTPEEQLLVDVHNEYRKQKVLVELELDEKLCIAAQGHADWMATNNNMSHTGKDGSTLGQRLQQVGYGYSFAGENIAAGYRTVDAVMNGWKNSSGHNANILNPKYLQMGIAVTNSNNGTRYWCAVFAQNYRGVVGQVLQESIPEGIEEK